MLELRYNLFVEEDSAKQRLDVWLSSQLPSWTRSQIKIQIENGGVVVNGKPVKKAGYLIKPNDKIDLQFTNNIDFMTALPENIDLDIVYEDHDIAVINKPQGMVVHPAPGSINHTLVNALLFHFSALSKDEQGIRPGIVHRIDKDTSGLLVVAKNNLAHENLAKQIAEHSAFRHYIALLEGNLKENSGTVNQPIARDKSDRKKMAIDCEGKPAITNYNVLERFVGYTLTEFILQTGRTHQIRVHSKFLNHPIVGDKTYGYTKQKFNLQGQLLHAYKLELTHPCTGKRMAFTCDLPNYFTNLLKKLKKV